MDVESEENLTKIRHIRNFMAVDCLSNITKVWCQQIIHLILNYSSTTDSKTYIVWIMNVVFIVPKILFTENSTGDIKEILCRIHWTL